MDFEKLLEKYKLQICLGLAGLILVGIGVLSIRSLSNVRQTPSLEILTDEKESPTLWVDLEGAVQNPGVYELPAEARINDLLIKAGGLSAEADREWVTKNINLAQKLSDGAKIFIPEAGEFEIISAQPASQVAGASASVKKQININTALAVQLDSLWGIGEKRAAAIIANRPYQEIEELKTKANIPSNVFERIKNEITVY